MQAGMRVLTPVLFWVGFLLLVLGAVFNSLWQKIAGGPTLLLAELALASVLAATIVRFALRCALATALMLVWLLALVCFAGIAASMAAVLVALAALGLGSLFLGEDPGARIALALLAGFALICGIDGWLLPFMVHTRTVYVLVLLGVVIFRWGAVIALLKGARREWDAGVAEAPGWATLAIVLVGVASTNAWLPSITYDSLAYHLGLPSQLVSLGYYQMNAATNLWALAPWAADVLQAVGWMVAGVEAHGAVDTLWFLASLALLWELCRELGLPPMLRWLAVAMYATVPVVASTLASMQTEGPTCAVVLAIALLIQRNARPTGRTLLLVASLLGLLMELKISNVLFAGPLGLWLLWRWRTGLPWRTVPGAVALVFVIGGSCYVYAYAVTGNPVLPLFNSFFHSPFAPLPNFHDGRWDSGFHWDIIWRLVFHSSRYIEASDGSPVLLLIALSGSLVVAVVRPRTRALALVGLAALLLPLYEIQYLRYVVPSFALLIPAMLGGVPVNVDQPACRRGMWVCLWSLPILGALYISNAGWQWSHNVLSAYLTSGHTAFLDHYAPSNSIANVVRHRYADTGRVLFADPDDALAAGFAGRAFVLNYYDYQLSTMAMHADADASGATWLRVLRFSGANLVVADPRHISRGLMAAIDAMRGTMVYRAGSDALWQLHLGQPGKAVPGQRYGWTVKFDTADAPSGPTLVDASLDLRCDFNAVQKGHIVVGWTGTGYSKYEWATCLPNNTAHVSIAAAVPGRVEQMNVTVQPSPSVDLGLQVLDSRVSFRRDLTTERDLSPRARRLFGFGWSKASSAKDHGP